MTRDEADAVRGVLLCWWMGASRRAWRWAVLNVAPGIVEMARRVCADASPTNAPYTRSGIERALAHFDEVNP
jgi:hypothetical protein